MNTIEKWCVHETPSAGGRVSVLNICGPNEQRMIVVWNETRQYLFTRLEDDGYWRENLEEIVEELGLIY